MFERTMRREDLQKSGNRPTLGKPVGIREKSLILEGQFIRFRTIELVRFISTILGIQSSAVKDDVATVVDNILAKPCSQNVVDLI